MRKLIRVARYSSCELWLVVTGIPMHPIQGMHRQRRVWMLRTFTVKSYEDYFVEEFLSKSVFQK